MVFFNSNNFVFKFINNYINNNENNNNNNFLFYPSNQIYGFFNSNNIFFSNLLIIILIIMKIIRFLDLTTTPGLNAIGLATKSDPNDMGLTSWV